MHLPSNLTPRIPFMDTPKITNMDALNNLYAAASEARLTAVQHARCSRDAQQLAEALKLTEPDVKTPPPKK